MVEVLREDHGGPRRRVGLVSNLSGIFSKQACALFSNEPNPGGFNSRTSRPRSRPAISPCRSATTTPARQPSSATVVFQGSVPSHAIAICDLPDGTRTVVRSEDPSVLDALMRTEHCGRTIDVAAGGGMALR
jgi:hypothetical protein